MYKSVFHIPVCPRLARKGMAGMVMAIPIFVYSIGTRSHTSKGLAMSMHAVSYAHFIVLESMGYYSLVGTQLERL